MKKISVLALLSIFTSACGIYSFTGASIPNDAKTVTVNYFTSNTINAPSSLSQTITEGLKDLFLTQTNLDLKESEGDLTFSGQVIRYQISPMAIQANETAGKNRLTIAIKVKYNNNFDAKKKFETTFSRYLDFDSSENLADIETDLIEVISKEIIEDVYNKAFANW